MSVTQNHFKSKADSNDFVDYDLEVISGEPRGGVHWLRDQSGGDGVLFTGLFRAEPSVFAYEFSGDESFHVIDGEIQIELDSGERVDLRAGDIASFPKGAKSTWTVKKPFRKFFVISG
ncbi:MAG: cupin domain-containing protein [Thermomicrobiales bacterium]